MVGHPLETWLYEELRDLLARIERRRLPRHSNVMFYVSLLDWARGLHVDGGIEEARELLGLIATMHAQWQPWVSPAETVREEIAKSIERARLLFFSEGAMS